MAGYNTRPTLANTPDIQKKTKNKEGDLVTLNEDAILNEMARMGEGIVDKIEILSSKPPVDGSEDEDNQDSEGEPEDETSSN